MAFIEGAQEKYLYKFDRLTCKLQGGRGDMMVPRGLGGHDGSKGAEGT